mmetsp:Transcript_71074/g.148220  ORF Transcript_71074/g.148220 Transcript_71074/m.148220 type:complete len:102 (+) Transcript_71074:60-365(+)
MRTPPKGKQALLPQPPPSVQYVSHTPLHPPCRKYAGTSRHFTPGVIARSAHDMPNIMGCWTPPCIMPGYCMPGYCMPGCGIIIGCCMPYCGIPIIGCCPTG